MKPAKFTYLRPETIPEALDLLSQYGEDGKIISGGQSLIPVMNMRLSTPQYLIDLGRVEDLRYISESEDKLAIGAMTRQRDVEHSPLVQYRCPILSETIKFVGHPQTRNRGTIGGSIAHGDPSAELPCVLTALRGEIVIASADEERIVEPEMFFLTYLLTSLEPHEMVTEVRFPFLNPGSGYAFEEITRRHRDFPLACVAAVVELDEDGLLARVQLAAGGVNPVPCVLEEVEDYLIGKEPTEEVIQAASEFVRDRIEPSDDLHGTETYRFDLAVAMTRRVLTKAILRAKGEKNDNG